MLTGFATAEDATIQRDQRRARLRVHQQAVGARRAEARRRSGPSSTTSWPSRTCVWSPKPRGRQLPSSTRVMDGLDTRRWRHRGRCRRHRSGGQPPGAKYLDLSHDEGEWPRMALRSSQARNRWPWKESLSCVWLDEATAAASRIVPDLECRRQGPPRFGSAPSALADTSDGIPRVAWSSSRRSPTSPCAGVRRDPGAVSIAQADDEPAPAAPRVRASRHLGDFANGARRTVGRDFVPATWRS